MMVIEALPIPTTADKERELQARRYDSVVKLELEQERATDHDDS